MSRYVAEISIVAQHFPGRARMTAAGPEAARNDSRSRMADRAAPGLARAASLALALAGVAGVVLLVAATFSPVVEISVGGSDAITADVDRSLSGYDRHSVALLLIALFAGAMLAGALRGARPAMLAVAACGIAVLLIAVLVDVPDLDRVGPVGELYEDARAEAGSGFYLETLGGALLLIAGGGLLAIGAGAPGPSGVRLRTDDRAETEDAPPAAARPAPPAPAASVPAPPPAEPGPEAEAGPEAETGPARPGPAASAARAAAAVGGRLAQARADRAARREREAARERDRAARRTGAHDEAETPEPPSAPEPPAAPPAPAAQPRPDADEPLSFDERLRRARERARGDSGPAG